jgi:hypothetical protein
MLHFFPVFFGKNGFLETLCTSEYHKKSTRCNDIGYWDGAPCYLFCFVDDLIFVEMFDLGFKRYALTGDGGMQRV